MRRFLVLVSMAGLVFTTTGCWQQKLQNNGCQGGSCGPAAPAIGQFVGQNACSGPNCGNLNGRPFAGHGQIQQGPPGPQAGTVGYPYYTTRGPRDFLLNNPPSIGR